MPLLDKKKNIVLIGMPGCGKSTVGVVLAKRLGFQFLDSDLCIQEKEGKRLHEIIAMDGLEEFQRIENEVNASFTVTECVIATGGSVVYGNEAMENLKQIGLVIYLKLPYYTIRERLGDLKKRGVVLKRGQSLKSLYEERIPLYEKYADVTVNCNHKRLRQIVTYICDMVEDSGNKGLSE